MSLWTPGGEHPVDRGGSAPGGPPPGPRAGPGQPELNPEQEAEARAMAAEMQQVREELVSVPAAVVVANHAMGLYELAAIHLSSQPPNLAEAQVAIDAFASLVDALKGRLGPDERVLDDALAQIRMAFVQIQASLGGDAAGPADHSAEPAEGSADADDAGSVGSHSESPAEG
ncbi:MAG: hypothetical protein JWM05_443 [Acidimicrobiales bacterium]|nr:hypothetical protein [Acidimicrobiales bacterium]